MPTATNSSTARAFNQVLANKKKFVNKKEFRRIAEEAVAKINFDVDLDALVETLPVADKQLIAISRALLDNAKLIIMDEPFVGLDPKASHFLKTTMRELCESGTMDEVRGDASLEDVFLELEDVQ